MNDIVKAIKTRWTNAGLGDSVTGGIWHSEAPERTTAPFCIFNEINTATTKNTRQSRYRKFDVQFDIYASGGDPETVADLAEAVENAFDHCHKAQTNPLTIDSASGRIHKVVADRGPTTKEGDQMYRAMVTCSFEYTKSQGLTPA